MRDVTYVGDVERAATGIVFDNAANKAVFVAVDMLAFAPRLAESVKIVETAST